MGGPVLICETISLPYIRWNENDTRIDKNSEIAKAFKLTFYSEIFNGLLYSEPKNAIGRVLH